MLRQALNLLIHLMEKFISAVFINLLHSCLFTMFSWTLADRLQIVFRSILNGLFCITSRILFGSRSHRYIKETLSLSRDYPLSVETTVLGLTLTGLTYDCFSTRKPMLCNVGNSQGTSYRVHLSIWACP